MEDFLNFMEETGAEYISRRGRWIYFRKDIKYGEFDIFSDIDSKIDHHLFCCSLLPHRLGRIHRKKNRWSANSF